MFVVCAKFPHTLLHSLSLSHHYDLFHPSFIGPPNVQGWTEGVLKTYGINNDESRTNVLVANIKGLELFVIFFLLALWATPS